MSDLKMRSLEPEIVEPGSPEYLAANVAGLRSSFVRMADSLQKASEAMLKPPTDIQDILDRFAEQDNPLRQRTIAYLERRFVERHRRRK
jgi:hypothetical protein